LLKEGGFWAMKFFLVMLKERYGSLIKKKRALTLIEMVISASLLTIVMGASYGVLRSNQITQQTGEANIQLYRECRRAIETISKELKLTSLKLSKAIIIDSDPDEIKFQIPVSINSTSTNVTWGAEFEEVSYPGDFIHYYIENNYLKKRVVDASNSVIAGPRIAAKNIVDLQIQQVNLTGGGSYLQIDVQARKSILFLRRELSYNLEYKVYPLN